MTTTTEIAPDVYRIATYVPMADLQFNQFLVRDDEPPLYHTGMRGLFPVVHEAVRSRQALIGYQASFLMAAMHGSTFIGQRRSSAA